MQMTTVVQVWLMVWLVGDDGWGWGFGEGVGMGMEVCGGGLVGWVGRVGGEDGGVWGVTGWVYEIVLQDVFFSQSILIGETCLRP